MKNAGLQPALSHFLVASFLTLGGSVSCSAAGPADPPNLGNPAAGGGGPGGSGSGGSGGPGGSGFGGSGATGGGPGGSAGGPGGGAGGGPNTAPGFQNLTPPLGPPLDPNGATPLTPPPPAGWNWYPIDGSQ